MVSVLSSAELQLFRLLRLVRVLRAGIYLELTVHVAAQRSLWQHSLDRFLDDTRRELCLQLGEVRGLQATGILAVSIVELALGLAARHPHFLRVDHDDVIAG